MGILRWFKKSKKSSLKTVQMNVQDQCISHWTDDTEDLNHEYVQTSLALAHMRRVLSHYSRYHRDTHMSYDDTCKYMAHIGLLQPFADDIRYLKRLKRMSSIGYINNVSII